MKYIYPIQGLMLTVDVSDDGILISIARHGETAQASVLVEVDESGVEMKVWDEKAEMGLFTPITIPLIQNG